MDRLLAASARAYRWLLVAYPPGFRRAYGPHMAQVFRDACRDARRRYGTAGVVMLWLSTLGDLAATAVVEQIAERRSGMSSTHLSRWSGLANIIGGILWLLLCTGLAFKWPVREYVGPLLAGIGIAFLAGLAGLYARYAGRVGYIGKLGLALAIVGAAPVAMVGTLKIAQTSDTGWPGFLLLTSLLFIGLVLFGVDALRTSARLPWGALPIVIGLDGLMIWGIESQASGAWQLIGLLYLFGMGWVLLGSIVWSDREERPPAMLPAAG